MDVKRKVDAIFGPTVFIGTIAILLFLAVPTFNNYAPLLDDALQRFTSDNAKWVLGFGTLYAALFLGLIAFVLRNWRWARPIYAFSEIFFGFYGAGIVLLLLYNPSLLPDTYQKLAPDASHTRYPTFVGLLSSIYVMVRGLDIEWNWFRQLKGGNTNDRSEWVDIEKFKELKGELEELKIYIQASGQNTDNSRSVVSGGPTQAPIGEAEKLLTELVRQIEIGDDVVLTRDGRPVVRLTHIARPS